MDDSQFFSVGRKLYEQGLIANASGNLSVRKGDNLLITRTGSQLRALTDKDLILTGLFRDDEMTPMASSELSVHREIFKRTEAAAIVHAHVPCATTLSMKEQKIVCPDYPYEVPVIGFGGVIKAGAHSGTIADMLKHYPLVLVYGHGSFAIADTLEEAYENTLRFEQTCCGICRSKSMEVDPDKLPKL